MNRLVRWWKYPRPYWYRCRCGAMVRRDYRAWHERYHDELRRFFREIQVKLVY